MITICVLALHLGYASCFNGTDADLKEQRDICARSTSCFEIRDKHDPQRRFFVHARTP